MSESYEPGRAMLRAIIASPDDDNVRLVYADWLDETGDDLDKIRARMIRFQYHRGRYPDATFDHAEAASLSRLLTDREIEKELVRRGGLESEVFERTVELNGSFGWEVGFVGYVKISMAGFCYDDFLHPRELVQCHPVRRIILKDRVPAYGERWQSDPTDWLSETYFWIPYPRTGTTTYEQHVPDVLVPFLTEPRITGYGQTVHYQKFHTAVNDLNRAACLYARYRANEDETT